LSLEQVHRGVTRRRRRRGAGTALGAAVVLAGAVLAVARPWVADTEVSPNPPATSGSTPTAHSSPSAAPSTRPTPSETASATSLVPAADFAPLSVTAISPTTYWVLGDQSCPWSCRILAVTTDGGRTFERLPASPTGPDTDGVRFGSAMDGWVFGKVTHSTHDGGRSWTPVELPGTVVRLEAAAGTVWAVVADGRSYRLFASPVSTDAWREVKLPRQITAPQPDLALQGSRMLLLAGGGSADVYRSDDGGRTVQRSPSPCVAELGGALSAVSDAVWARCATGTMAKLSVSTDGGESFHDVAGPSLPNSAVIGARTRDEVFVADAERTLTLEQGGRDVAVSTPRRGVVCYLGFTTGSVGVALTSDTPQLWRTVDAGRTWSVVTVGH
jgi:photosystem II stability/assembly factor-like uncharacterized protein